MCNIIDNASPSRGVRRISGRVAPHIKRPGCDGLSIKRAKLGAETKEKKCRTAGNK